MGHVPANRRNRVPAMFAAAERLWPHLAEAARDRYRLTYAATAGRIGYGTPTLAAPVRLPCWLTMLYCRQNNLPPVNALVVNDKTGIPGDNIPMEYYPDAPNEWTEVFGHVAAVDWSRVDTPTASTFIEAERRFRRGDMPTSPVFEGTPVDVEHWGLVRAGD